MEIIMVEAVLFIGAVIAGVTQAVKLALPERVHGIVTVLVAVLVGVVVALIDTAVGVEDISVASGIMIALGTVGVVTTADRI